MAKIKLASSNEAQVKVSDEPIIILNSAKKQGYLTTHGFVSFGSIFVDQFNAVHDDIDTAFSEMDKNNLDYLPICSHLSECFHNISYDEILYCFEHKTISMPLKEKISESTNTLPFRVGIYKNEPVLYYIGYEDDLFLYDFLMIFQHKIKIKLCSDCNRAFVQSSKNKYCDSCKTLAQRNRAKYNSLKNDPVRLKYTRIQQRIKNRNDSENYRFLYERLAANNKNLAWLEKWDTLDKRYKQIKRERIEYECTSEAWNNNLGKANIQSINDFATWLNRQQRGNANV